MCVHISVFYIHIVCVQNLKQLRMELQMLGIKLQSGERACCRNTDGEKLRHALSSADSKLAKQVTCKRSMLLMLFLAQCTFII